MEIHNVKRSHFILAQHTGQATSIAAQYWGYKHVECMVSTLMNIYLIYLV